MAETSPGCILRLTIWTLILTDILSSSYSFKPNEGVIIIGATNFPEALDKYVCVRIYA